MKINPVKCEAIEVRTASKACVGLARTTQGESCLIDGRTPESPGMCANASTFARSRFFFLQSIMY